MLSVFKSNIDDRIFIADKDNFEITNLCECYDSYGNQVGCTNAGCQSRENIYCQDYFESSPEEPDSHIQALAWTYWNGYNHNSMILSCNDNPSITPDLEELEGEAAEKILEAFQEVDADMYGKFQKDEEVNGIKFHLSLHQGIPWDAEIKEV